MADLPKILNLTQHQPTQEQISAGVFSPVNHEEVKTLLTFKTVPEAGEIANRAKSLAKIATAEEVKFAMVGGAGYLMPSLEHELRKAGITPVHSFTERRSVETVKDGETIKTAIFVHIGWVQTPTL